MNALGWLAHPWALLWTEALLHFVWQGAVLAGLASLVLRMQSPQRRYAGLIAIFFAMTICPFITLAVFPPASDWNAVNGETYAINPQMAFLDLSETLPSHNFVLGNANALTPLEEKHETGQFN